MKQKAGIWLIFLIIAFAVPLSYSFKTLDPVLIPRLFVLSIFLLVLTILQWKFAKEIRFSRLAILIISCYSIYILVVFVSGINSLNIYEAVFEGLRNILFLILFIFLVLNVKTDQNLHTLIKACIIGTFIVSQIGLYQLLTTDAPEFVLIRSTLGNKNLLSSFLYLLFPFSIFSMYFHKKSWRLFSCYVFASALILITYSITRAVWIAIFVTFILALTLLFTYSLKYHEKLITKAKLIPLFNAALSYIIIAVVLFLFSPKPVITHFKKDFKKDVLRINDELASAEAGNINTRLVLWENTKQIFNRSPLYGIGARNWRFTHQEYGLELLNYETKQGLKHYQWAHNDYLGVLSETGILGFVFYFGMLGLALIFALISFFNNTQKEYQLLSALLFSSIMGLLIISFFSFPKERSAHNFILFLTIAIVVFLYPKNKKAVFTVKYKRLLHAITLLCVVAISLAMWQQLSGEYYTKEALIARSYNKHTRVIKLINKAEKPFYKYDNFSTPLCWYKGEALFRLGEKEAALIEFQKAYSLHPNHLYVLNNLASCYEITGNHEKSIQFYKQALEISPKFEEALVNLSIVYYNQNEFDKAYETIRTCPTTSEQSNYKRALLAILKKQLDQVNNQSLSEFKILEELKTNNEFLLGAFKESLSNNISFRQQLEKSIQS